MNSSNITMLFYEQLYLEVKTNYQYNSGADTGFSVGGGANPWGAPTYKFSRFSQKLHEIKKILVRGGGRGEGRAPGAPPLGSATAIISKKLGHVSIHQKV